MDKHQLIEELRAMDEITLVELLELTSEDIVDAFQDVVEEKQVKLIRYIYDNV